MGEGYNSIRKFKPTGFFLAHPDLVGLPSSCDQRTPGSGRGSPKNTLSLRSLSELPTALLLLLRDRGMSCAVLVSGQEPDGVCRSEERELPALTWVGKQSGKLGLSLSLARPLEALPFPCL